MAKSSKPYTRLLRVSTTRVDGGSLFGATPKENWERFVSPDRQNRIAIGNYSMLIDHPDGWVLVNAGPGDKAPLSLDVAPMRSRSSLIRELKELGLMAKDIATVIYTHMHDEHVGGGTHMTSSGRVLPTFPNARYIIHKDALEQAMNPSERCRHLYRSDDHEPLLESNQVMVVDGTTEVCSGVWVEPAVGPTPGHQIVICQDGQSTFAFLGSLVPTSMHLWAGVNCATDWNPEATARTKNEMKRQANVEGWEVAPVGSDTWVPASELEGLAAFSIGQAQSLPKKKQRAKEPVSSDSLLVRRSSSSPISVS